MPKAQLADRAVLSIAGADARPWLQDLVTNDVDLLTPATPVWAGLLGAQGKPLFDMILFDGGAYAPGAIFADVAAASADTLVKRLTMYRLRRAVSVERIDTLHVFAAWDVSVDEVPSDPRLPALGQRWIAETATTDATTADWHRHRLALGVPDSGDLLLDKMLWLETNAGELNGVSFTKGCYVGQENTARMHYRDKLRRRLLPVTIDGDPGDGAITIGGTTVGELRSRAEGRGIAYLRVEDADAPLVAGTARLTVAWPDWLPPK